MIATLLATALMSIHSGAQTQGYDVWGLPPATQGGTIALKDKDRFIVAAGNATGGMAKELRRLKAEGKVLDASKSLMPTAVPIADEINYLNDQIRQKIHGDRMTAVNQSLTYLLLASDQPSFTGVQNPYVRHTKAPMVELPGIDIKVSRELGLAVRVAQSGGNLMPEDILRFSLEACKGDLQSALLTSHNFLKELGYASRPGAAGPAMFARIPSSATDRQTAKAEADQITKAIGYGFRAFAIKQDDGRYVFDIVAIDPDPMIGKLRELRPPGDIVDKMGPWYHSFIGLVIGSSATGGAMTAETWAKIEGLMRTLSIFKLFSSPPDYFKELLTERMAMESGTLMEILATSIKVDPSRSEVDQGDSKSFRAQASLPTSKSGVWYKWSFGDGSPALWTRESVATHKFDKSGQLTVAVELYDDLKSMILARASASITVSAKQTVAGAWNLTGARVVEEAGFKDQNAASTGGHNSWSGDPLAGRIYRSSRWGWEHTPYVSPLRLEATHVWEIPKVLKPGTKVKIRLSIVDIKYTKVDPQPSQRGYTMATVMYVSIPYTPNSAATYEIGKGVFDGSKDMNSPEPVEQVHEWLVPKPSGKEDLLVRINVGGTRPFVIFELTYKMK